MLEVSDRQHPGLNVAEQIGSQGHGRLVQSGQTFCGRRDTPDGSAQHRVLDDRSSLNALWYFSTKDISATMAKCRGLAAGAKA